MYLNQGVDFWMSQRWTRARWIWHSKWKVCPLIFLVLLIGCGAARPPAGHPEARSAAPEFRATLAILESTDIHAHILGYDYLKLTWDPAFGFDRMATLVQQAREEFVNHLLFDVGDAIQGTALADYQARMGKLPCAKELATYKAMNALGYDGATLGNHDFDFGLPFLKQVTGAAFPIEGNAEQDCQGSHFPLTVAHVFSTREKRPLFPAYLILNRPLQAFTTDGRSRIVNLRIGVLGFLPPQIMKWNQRHLQNKVYVRPPVQAATQLIPTLRAESVDIVIALSHGGLDPSPDSAETEDFSWQLSKVPGIDVLLLGHAHATFPEPDNPQSRFAHMPGVDPTRGTINGVPAVMGSFWGKGLGVVILALYYEKGRWYVDKDHTRSEVRLGKKKDGRYVQPDQQIRKLVTAEHQATLAYLRTPIGQSDFRITSYFAELGDVSALQLINMAQRDYVKRYLKSHLPQYAKLPVLSMAAPFRTGFAGFDDYTDIPAGRLSIRSAVDLYGYDNTLTAVKVSGAELGAWLEAAARHFHQIDPSRTAAQPLINPDVHAYDFDVLQGDVSYTIDVTQPVGRRIFALRYRGKKVTPGQVFIVATTSYRANGGGGFPGLDGSKTLFSAPATNREVLIEYIRSQRHLSRARFACDRSWQFRRCKTAGPVTFISAANKLKVAQAVGLSNLSLGQVKDDGMAEYIVELNRSSEIAPAAQHDSRGCY